MMFEKGAPLTETIPVRYTAVERGKIVEVAERMGLNRSELHRLAMSEFFKSKRIRSLMRSRTRGGRHA